MNEFDIDKNGKVRVCSSHSTRCIVLQCCGSPPPPPLLPSPPPPPHPQLDDEEVAEFLQVMLNAIIGRVAQASEIADAIVFLAAETSGMITGTSLVVDGGRACMGAR